MEYLKQCIGILLMCECGCYAIHLFAGENDKFAWYVPGGAGVILAILIISGYMGFLLVSGEF